MNHTDYWVRQQSANTGTISPGEAISALEKISTNISNGLFPTTGGAVSLMAREDVELLHGQNRGFRAKFRPKIPDSGGTRAKSLGDWYVAAFEQALFHGPRPFDKRLIMDMDGFLATYQGAAVDWRRIYTYAKSQQPQVPPMGGSCWKTGSTNMPWTIRAFLNS